MNMWILHEGAPPHYALCSKQMLNEIFYEKWIRKKVEKKEYAENVPKLHHKFWLKLDGLFISELTSAHKS